MEEIKVGEYVRTKDGFIFKILTKEECSYGYHGMTDSSEKYSTYTYGKGSRNDIKNKIENHSFNIINLIEVGDYVNLERILDISEEYIRTTERIHNKNWLQSNIETILTHEQFKQNCYKLDLK